MSSVLKQILENDERSIVFDCCISWISMDMMNVDPKKKELVLPRYLKAGFNFVSLTVAGDWGCGVSPTISWLASERRYLAEKHPDTCVLISSLADIFAAKREGKLAVTFHFQGSRPFQVSPGVGEDPGDINLVQLYFDLGVRQCLLSLNLRNHAADGCKEKSDAGLSNWGVRLVKEMNRVGMIVDCTHTGYRSTMDAMSVSTKPVLFSHSNAKGVFNHPRNIADDQIKACAKTGGVVCVCGWGPIVNAENNPTAEAVVKHIDYIANLVGPEHVGIGLDYTYDPTLTTKRVKQYAYLYAPYGTLEDYNYHHDVMRSMQPEAISDIAETLLHRGYGEENIRGILGGNCIRVMQANWEAG